MKLKFSHYFILVLILMLCYWFTFFQKVELQIPVMLRPLTLFLFSVVLLTGFFLWNSPRNPYELSARIVIFYMPLLVLIMLAEQVARVIDFSNLNSLLKEMLLFGITIVGPYSAGFLYRSSRHHRAE